MKHIQILEARHNSLAESISGSFDGSRNGSIADIDAALNDYLDDNMSFTDSVVFCYDGLTGCAGATGYLGHTGCIEYTDYTGETGHNECYEQIVFDGGNAANIYSIGDISEYLETESAFCISYTGFTGYTGHTGHIHYIIHTCCTGDTGDTGCTG